MPAKDRGLTTGKLISQRYGSAFRAKRDYIVKVDASLLKERGSSILDKKVLWRGQHTKIRGRVVGFHGKSAVRVRFRKGIPGQALGTTVYIVGS